MYAKIYGVTLKERACLSQSLSALDRQREANCVSRVTAIERDLCALERQIFGSDSSLAASDLTRSFTYSEPDSNSRSRERQWKHDVSGRVSEKTIFFLAFQGRTWRVDFPRNCSGKIGNFPKDSREIADPYE